MSNFAANTYFQEVETARFLPLNLKHVIMKQSAGCQDYFLHLLHAHRNVRNKLSAQKCLLVFSIMLVKKVISRVLCNYLYLLM